MRHRVLVALSAVALLAYGAGCLGVEGGISDPVVSDDPVTNVGEDTGTPGPGDEDTGAAGDDSGAPSTEDTSTGADTNAPKTDTGTSADTSVKDTAPADTGTVVTDTGPSTGWPAAYADLEQGILVETNKRRAAGASCGTKGSFGPAGPLVMQAQLQTAARKHSQDMATKNYFAHANLAGASPFDRMRAEGYKGSTMGENIAAGNATVAATMDQWMKSDGHCANIMSKSFTQLGVGYFMGPTSTYKHYWTQNFGAGG